MSPPAKADIDILQDRNQRKQESGTVIQSFGSGAGVLKININGLSVSPATDCWLNVSLNGKPYGSGDTLSNSEHSTLSIKGEPITFEKEIPNGTYNVEIKLYSEKVYKRAIYYGGGYNRKGANLIESDTVRSVQILQGKTTSIEGEYDCGAFTCEIEIQMVYTE